MANENDITESGTAGKPGESTAAATRAASERTKSHSNLLPDGVASLLADALKGPATAREASEATASPNAAGDESAATEEVSRNSSETTEAENSPDVESATDTETNTHAEDVPAEIADDVAAWEANGGRLPPKLQSIVDKRIGREVGKVKDLEARATTAEAELERLKGELETERARPQTSTASSALPNAVTTEKDLNALLTTSKRFQADARAYLGGYADDPQAERIKSHLERTGKDENALRRQLDEVNDWIAEEAPQLRERVKAFSTAERQALNVAKEKFAFLDDPKSPDAQLAAEILQIVPELKSRTPAWKLAMGVYALGMREWKRMQATATASTNGNGNGNGHSKAVLPGKAPARTATGGSAPHARVNNPKAAAEEAASEELRQNPTADAVTKALRLSLQAK